MITHPFVLGKGPKEEVWEITVDTEATEAGAKHTGIPIVLYRQPGVKVTVDWGDGTESALTYKSYEDGSLDASVHEYAVPGTYKVSMKSTKWPYIYIGAFPGSSASSVNNFQYFRNTLVGTGVIPKIRGTYYRSPVRPIWTKLISSLSYLFAYCAHLSYVPADLFIYSSNITDVNHCFYHCDSLSSVPDGLFAGAENVSDFNECFSFCSSLTSIPGGLFSNCVKAKSFISCFYSCSGIVSIPEGLFANNVNATTFATCFAYCASISTIPAGLFRNNASVTSFAGCFSNCSGLLEIPEGLFSGNPEVNSFNRCFDYCSLLPSVPEDLFVNNPKAENFGNCFRCCRGISSIPSGLFRNNTKITNLHMTFFDCNLSDIPVELLTNCPAVTDLSGTFGGNPISSVPSGLFDSQTLVTTIGNNANTPNGIFNAGTIGIINIDENLFAHMLNLTQARFAFRGHYGFSIRFRATELTDITEFCDKNDEQQVTVYVPAGSATAEAFHAIADTNGIIVVEE